MALFWEIYVFLQVSWIGLLEKNELFSILKTVNSKSYSFQKLNYHKETMC
jgi:hypothetical protein